MYDLSVPCLFDKLLQPSKSKTMVHLLWSIRGSQIYVQKRTICMQILWTVCFFKQLCFSMIPHTSYKPRCCPSTINLVLIFSHSFSRDWQKIVPTITFPCKVACVWFISHGPSGWYCCLSWFEFFVTSVLHFV